MTSSRFDAGALPLQPKNEGAQGTGECQIYQVVEHGELRWKWRAVAPDGAQTQSPESYAFHYQCAAAARKRGYRPQMKWLPAELPASAS